jgi:catechol 2,3-dioxygenase-like lactoylglutathione lyase family enzyme
MPFSRCRSRIAASSFGILKNSIRNDAHKSRDRDDPQRLMSLSPSEYTMRGNTRRFLMSHASQAVESQPLIAVRDVRASSRWYTELLGLAGLPEHPHRDGYDALSSSGRMVLQLHAWDEENHPNLAGRTAAPLGHGVLLWFMVGDFEAAVARARSLGAEVIQDAHINPAPNQWEIWLRDPDGYVVVVAGPQGGAAGSISATRKSL